MEVANHYTSVPSRRMFELDRVFQCDKMFAVKGCVPTDATKIPCPKKLTNFLTPPTDMELSSLSSTTSINNVVHRELFQQHSNRL